MLYGLISRLSEFVNGFKLKKDSLNSLEERIIKEDIESIIEEFGRRFTTRELLITWPTSTFDKDQLIRRTMEDLSQEFKDYKFELGRKLVSCITMEKNLYESGVSKVDNNSVYGFENREDLYKTIKSLKTPLSKLYFLYELNKANRQDHMRGSLKDKMKVFMAAQEKSASNEKLLGFISKYNERPSEFYAKFLENAKILDDLDHISEASELDFSGFTLLDRLGSGNYGTTYLVEDKLLKTKRALKVLKHANNEEAENLAKFTGQDLDNIVQIIAARNDLVTRGSDLVFSILMEYIEGTTLKKYMNNKNITTQEAIRFSLQMYKGVRVMIEKGIYHRDINPANIMVTSDKNIKIVDFGVSTELNTTSEYNRRYGGPTDFFPIGMITYEMLTNKHLIYPRNTQMDSQMHASIVKEQKQKIYNEEGELQGWFVRSLYKNLEKTHADLVKTLLISEYNDEEISRIQNSYISINNELSYEFWTKQECVDFIKKMKQ